MLNSRANCPLNLPKEEGFDPSPAWWKSMITSLFVLPMALMSAKLIWTSRWDSPHFVAGIALAAMSGPIITKWLKNIIAAAIVHILRNPGSKF